MVRCIFYVIGYLYNWCVCVCVCLVMMSWRSVSTSWTRTETECSAKTRWCRWSARWWASTGHEHLHWCRCSTATRTATSTRPSSCRCGRPCSAARRASTVPGLSARATALSRTQRFVFSYNSVQHSAQSAQIRMPPVIMLLLTALTHLHLHYLFRNIVIHRHYYVHIFVSVWQTEHWCITQLVTLAYKSISMR